MKKILIVILFYILSNELTLAKAPKFHDFEGVNFMEHIDSVLKGTDKKLFEISYLLSNRIVVLTQKRKDPRFSYITHTVKYFFLEGRFYYGEIYTKVDSKNVTDYANYYTENKRRYIELDHSCICSESFDLKYCQGLKSSDVSVDYKIKYEINLFHETDNDYCVKESYSFIW
jgi:hypothetical protein